jgi:hypothetical protein
MSTKESDDKDPYLRVRRVLDDGRVVRLHKMFGQNTRLTLATNEDSLFFEQMYCYHDTLKAVEQACTWDGNGDPEGWYRHINTGRRRPDGDPAKEYIEP